MVVRQYHRRCCQFLHTSPSAPRPDRRIWAWIGCGADLDGWLYYDSTGNGVTETSRIVPSGPLSTSNLPPNSSAASRIDHKPMPEATLGGAENTRCRSEEHTSEL